jgi:glycosyltransferase involved in cell wall biosynthesis
MHLRMLHTFFYPDQSSVSQIISDVAFHMARHGNRVEAIASRGHYEGGGQRLPRRQEEGGVTIRRIWGPSLGKGSMLARLADLGSFAVGSFWAALTSRRCDKLMVLTNPPMYAAMATLLGFLRREPYVYVVMDLYPDVAVKAGLLKPRGLITRLLRRITRWTLRRAHRVAVLGTCMADAVAAYGVDRSRIAILRNWADEQAIHPLPPADNPLRKRLGLEGKFVVMYSGNMGVGHRFEDILNAALLLRSRDDIRFLFVGGGVRRKEVEAFVAEHQLANVQVMGYFQRGELGHSLTLGDAHFVSLREGYEGLIVPSKAYGIMAAGRPMIYQGNPRGEIARMLIEEGGGVVAAEGDADGLAAIIRQWADDPAAAQALGQRARRLLEEKYSASIALENYRRLLEETP